MNTLRISMCVAVAAIAGALSLGGSTPARAEEPATRPAAEAPPQFAQGGGGFGGYFGSPREWEDMMNFMGQYAPNRARVLSDMGPQPERGFRRRLLMKWRNYNYMHDHFPKMAKLYERRMALEDELFGLTMQAKQFPASRTEINLDIHRKVAALVDVGIEERQLRIEHMQELLAAEKMKLAHDQERRNDLVEERVDRLMERIRSTPTSDSTTRSEAAPAEDAPVFADAGLMADNP